MEFRKNDDYFRHENLVNTSIISQKNSNINVEKMTKSYKNSDKSCSQNTQTKKTSKASDIIAMEKNDKKLYTKSVSGMTPSD